MGVGVLGSLVGTREEAKHTSYFDIQARHKNTTSERTGS